MNEPIERLNRAAEAGLEAENLVLNFSASAERVKGATPGKRTPRASDCEGLGASLGSSRGVELPWLQGVTSSP
jgi:hypothetical protein